ncbi:hypothetical protein IW140_005276 [Coemansia sp. RSA 1813]|nr:hypothetical protein EV178_005868 [Coemansia sp. RSA 1646]KAJ1768776.1 hypothetical protein LPJ74_004576 [Coemansia sp. RSA 1843]KAJ2085609.1 hypothetical protein IW138_006218 [Coemansia sp. RSA 986]KAJ2212308.1 hypothetical protein EV179_004778 [Coemansia sp. RSA 487]KAJ2565587.1 hypothetical protein IW140_005276 [Coemansia sp. RSA 1813]
MGRKKINIREIENSRQKTVTFARRRAGLIKKAHELSILCGVKVAILMFDSKHASHVYSSSDTPEDLFARYLNKQFLTNESRKRKDRGDISVGGEGTYGFDDTGSFIRRRLAVVNQYRVTSDGPSSENLHVKYTKQYHNPGAANANQDRLSSSSTIAPNLNMMQGTMLGGATEPMHGCNGTSVDMDLQQQQALALPARSISLVKRGGHPTLSVTVSSDTGSSPESSFAQLFHPHQSVRGPPAFVDDRPSSTNHADNIVLTARDLSSLSLLSDKRMHSVATGSSPMSAVSSFNTACNEYHQNSQHGLIDSKCAATLDANCMDGLFGMVDRKPQHGASATDEPRAKRPKSQSFADGGDDKCMLDQGLVEQFLANADVAQLLQTSWHDDTKASGSAVASGSGTHSHNQDDGDDDDGDDDSENESDDGDEDDDSELDDEEEDEEDTELEESSHSENEHRHHHHHNHISAKNTSHNGDPIVGQTVGQSDSTGGSVPINGLVMSQEIASGLQGNGSIAPANNSYSFYSAEGFQAFTQPPPASSQMSISTGNMPSQQYQYPFVDMPNVPAPFELVNMMDARHNPMVLFSQNEGGGNHQAYKLHPDIAYAINDKVF